MTEPPSLWHFGPEGSPITVANAEAVLAHLSLFLGGWPLRWAGAAGAPAEADIAIEESAAGGFTVTLCDGPGRSSYGNPWDAANGFAGALISAYVARNPALVCLHAGAAMVGGGVVVLAGGSNAGKSSVSLHLAAAGYRLFGDDRMAVDMADAARPRALCLGLMPKVRLPLPPDCGARFAEFIEGYSEVQDETAAYLKPWEGEAATFGETAPLRALVVLDRADDAPVTLAPIGRADMLRSLIENATAPRRAAETLVAQLDSLARALPAYRLRFGSSRAAAAALAAALAGSAAGA